MRILRQAGVSRPGGGGWGGASVCGKNAAGGFRRNGITNGTAKTPSACGRCNAGMRRNGNRSVGPNPRDASDTRRQNASGENGGHLSPQRRPKTRPSPRTRLRSLARGHAAKKFSEAFCDRPGCYEPVRESRCAPASYCGDDCRAAMRRVRDRERKSLRRKTEAGRFKRRLEYQAAWAQRREGHVASGATAGGLSSARSGAKAHTVLFYRYGNDPALNLSVPTEVTVHDPQTDSGSRPRAPPAP